MDKYANNPEQLNCKYELFCKWYSKECYEPRCWRAIFLDDIIPQKHLKTIETILYNGNKRT